MYCHIHEQTPAVGTCVGCGKFICRECNTEINEKNYCKKCVQELFNQQSKKIEKSEERASSAAPTVFMNAGGAAASSSSSSSSSSSPSSRYRLMTPYPHQSMAIHLLLLFFTCGVGNVIYYIYIKNKQAEWTRINLM